MWNASLIDGPIPVPTLDADGNPIGTEPGYHLNIAPELLTSELEPFRVEPASPARVWAGDTPVWSTVFLKFADEAEARGMLGAWWSESETEKET